MFPGRTTGEGILRIPKELLRISQGFLRVPHNLDVRGCQRSREVLLVPPEGRRGKSPCRSGRTWR